MVRRILHKFSLLQALAIMIIIALVSPLPLLLGTYVHSAYKAKQDESIVIDTKKFNLSSEIFAESLWNYYPELGQKMIDQLTLDPNILYISIKDTGDRVFLEWKSQTKTSSNNLFILNKKLEKNGTIIGSLEMGFKTLGILESVISDIMLFGTTLLLQLIFIVIVISFIYYYKIIKPIKRLMYHSSLLSEQKLDQPFIWDSNDEIGSLGTALEQTRIKLKELFAKLKEENETLDEKVRQRTKELEDTSRYKSQFLANMSHEIRTPMNAIMGMTHLMGKTAINKEQANYVNKIKEASSILLRIINDILDFSKIESGKMEIENIAFDLHKEIKKSSSIFSVLIKEKNLEFSNDFINTHRFFRGDPHKIMQIINNFLSNAIKFTTNGTIMLRVEENAQYDGTSKLTFSVEDTGLGIAPEKQAFLFKAFGQLDASITRKHGGTGLGLFICTQLADMMNGSISVESIENQGSIFSFHLTLPSVQGLDIQKENPSSFSTPLNILLIEDDEFVRDTLSDFIRSFGFFVTCQKSDDDIVTQVNEFSVSYNLLIIDYELLNYDGFSIYEKIKKSVLKDKLPPVLMISFNNDTILTNSMLYDEIISLCQVTTNKSIFDPSSIDLSQKRVLLVEDNDINLEVATCLLKDTKAKITIAKNGLEAVEFVKNGLFDVILMDIQMPLMDGYEATRIIRKELKVTTPIIAMTANVMSHDIEKCILMGMELHIGKPFDVEDFYGTLLEALHVSLVFAAKEKIEDTTEQIFNKQEAIRKLAGDETLWTKILCSFYEQYINLPHSIKALLEEEKRTLLIDYIHTFKGLCGTIGAFALQREAAQVEASLKDGKGMEILDIDTLLKKHKELFWVLMQEYAGIVPIASEIQQQDEVTEEIVQLLDALKSSLKTYNASNVNLILDKLVMYQTIGRHDLFKSIVLLCSKFDFDESLLVLEHLKMELSNG
ncbi:MAG: response regulator [Campylobacteraceae bacterium]|nr:response regulator [Campylobacteraceae bacterium]